MTPEEIGALQQQLYALQAENAALRQELQRLAAQQQASAQRRQQVIRGGGRLLIPLLDRQKVVRSFGKLVETTGGFTAAREQWPTRDEVLTDARLFLESLVRFFIRRRMFFLILGLLGAVIPGIQIWLVVQQNQIIDKQTVLIEEQLHQSEIQVFDVVSRSLTEGDRNAKLMTGALLSRAEPRFLEGVIEEAFDPELQGAYQSDAIHAATRRLEDAAFRGHLARAAVRAFHRQLRPEDGTAVDPKAVEAIVSTSLPPLRLILRDAADRVPEVLRIGAQGSASDGALDEQVNGYLVQVGMTMRLHARLLRASGRETELFEDLRPLLQRVKWSELPGSRFAKSWTRAMEELLIELALAPDLGAELTASSDDATPAKGLAILREGVAGEGVQWDDLSARVGS
ncbi:hypothetical protein [Paraliomyxa miuraensis]|uniref:hypothetical protein n=1 Tax=Paraliomyxa miuraensis TaxID=376150 RepID=UPI0022542C96|nr:hypothetical protein [Paraliomyxa miuraensis]MCX4240571.1 hypothetical protein [Paraliomyxa miuraensis]